VISAGGIEAIASGATVSGLKVASGVTLLVDSGGTAAGTKLLSGGTETVSASGKIVGAVTFAPKATLSIAGTTGIAPTISGFAATDTLDLASFTFKTTEKLSFVENAAKTQGVLTVTDGEHYLVRAIYGSGIPLGDRQSRGNGDHLFGGETQRPCRSYRRSRLAAASMAAAQAIRHPAL